MTEIKIYKYFWLGTILLFLCACKKEESETPINDYLSPVGEVDLPAEIQLGQSVNMLVKHTGYNGCAIYSRTETIEKGNEIEVIFYAKGRPDQTACTEALITIETPFKYTLKNKGTYIFKFNQRYTQSQQEKYLIKTVVVK